MEKCVIHIVSNKAWGGGEQYVHDLARRQLADGYRVLAVCRPVESVVSRFRALGILSDTLPLRGMADLQSACQLASLLKKTQDSCLVHVHNFKDAFTAAYASRLAGRSDVRLVMTRHLVRTGKTSLPYRWLYRQLDAVAFVSDLARTEFFSTRPTLPMGRTAVIRPAVMVPDGVEPADLRGHYALPSTDLIAMYHGRLDPEKGLDPLLEAMATLHGRPLQLLLVGRGSDAYTAQLKQKAQALGIADRIHFIGFQSEVLPYVAAADFGVLSSTVQEACLLSAQEYMSQGIPVVTTDNGGQREYLHHGENSLLVPPADPTALADAMARLADDADLRRRLGRQAKADFDSALAYDHFYRAMRTLYQSLEH